MESFTSFEEKVPDPVLTYLSEKHKTLIHDYRTPDGKYIEGCTLIASDIAEMLLKEGKKPEILFIRGKRLDNSAVNEPLKPIQYEGRVSWGAHMVCSCDGLIYDPMIGKPLPTENYIHEAFGVDVEIETKVPQDKIEDLVNR